MPFRLRIPGTDLVRLTSGGHLVTSKSLPETYGASFFPNVFVNPVVSIIAVPVNTVAPALDAVEYSVGDTASCDTGTWTNLPVSYSYQWLLDGVPLVLETSSTHIVLWSDHGATLSCLVTATNAGGDSIPEESNGSGVVAPPSNTVPPVVSGTVEIGEILSTTNGTWTGTPTVTFTYQWARYNASNVYVENISLATSSTYEITEDDVGYKIACVVTGTNGYGNSDGTSNLTTVVPAAAIEFPATFDGTLVARYKADEETGLTTGDNLTIATDLSVNGNDLSTIGGSPTWESPVVNGHAVYRGDGASDYISGVFGAAVTGGDYVIGIVRKWNSAYSGQEVLVDGSGQFQGAYYRTSSNVGNAFFNNGSPMIGATTGPTDQWGYVECRVNGASSTVKVNGNIVASGSLTNTTLAGLTMFADGSTAQKSDGDIAEVFVINTPSTDDLTACEQYAMAEYGLAPPPGATANIVCVGDSNTAGTLTFAESYPAQLQGLLNSSYPGAYVVNTGVGGLTWLNLIANEAAYTALVQPGIPNILVVQCGLNDYDAGASVATIISRMETFVDLMTPNYDEVVVLTPMSAELAGTDFVGTDFEDTADGYMSATVDANVTLVDQRTAAPAIGAAGAHLTSKFQSDHKHFAVTGNADEAALVESIVVSLLP